MSTILKALRRLEEEEAKGRSASATPPRVGVDLEASLGSDLLRERIFAEEAASEAAPPEDRSGVFSRDALGSSKVVLAIATVLGLLVLAGGAQWLRVSGGRGVVDLLALGETAAPPAIAPRSPTAPSVLQSPARTPGQTTPEQTAPVAALAPDETPAADVVSPPVRIVASPRPEPPPPAAPSAPVRETALAAVAPTPSVVEAQRIERSRVEPAPAPDPKPMTAPKPRADLASPPPPVAAREPANESQARASVAVERIDRRGLPDVLVRRTTWHPTPDRRSASVRVGATGQELTLREGDAVGGLVLKEISPSSVLFEAGEVEIRRRVGAEN